MCIERQPLSWWTAERFVLKRKHFHFTMAHKFGSRKDSSLSEEQLAYLLVDREGPLKGLGPKDIFDHRLNIYGPAGQGRKALYDRWNRLNGLKNKNPDAYK